MISRSVRRRLALGRRLVLSWRPTGLNLAGLIRTMVTSFVALGVTFWVLPGEQTTGPLSVVANRTNDKFSRARKQWAASLAVVFSRNFNSTRANLAQFHISRHVARAGQQRLDKYRFQYRLPAAIDSATVLDQRRIGQFGRTGRHHVRPKRTKLPDNPVNASR